MRRRDETGIAARVARRLGLGFTETVVLNRGTNVLVHLSPAPVVARVTRLAHLVRPVSDLAGAMALARSETMRGHVAPPTTLLDTETIEIAVADSGPGLAKEVANRLFEPFVSTKISGMGLGLSICRSIVEAHGGRLKGEPNFGGGTVFRFTLAAVSRGDQRYGD